MSAPLVSVLMPVYNAERTLDEAMSSILNQTLTDFEFIIIDDASTDSSKEIIHSYSDKRIRYLENEKNEGYIHSLNRALPLARGNYLARMDADDISKPERFARQFDFLTKEQSVDLVGASVQLIDNGKFEVWDYPQDPGGVRARLLFNTAHAHPVIFFRRKLVDAGVYFYDPGYYPAEDYHLWVELSRKINTANLKDVLLNYRIGKTQTASIAADRRRHNASRVQADYFVSLLPDRFTNDEKSVYDFWHSGFRIETAIATRIFSGFELIYASHNEQFFKSEFELRMNHLIHHLYQRQPQLVSMYMKSAFGRRMPLPWYDRVKFSLKNLLRGNNAG